MAKYLYPKLSDKDKVQVLLKYTPKIIVSSGGNVVITGSVTVPGTLLNEQSYNPE